jgi:hypothetical protein
MHACRYAIHHVTKRFGLPEITGRVGVACILYSDWRNAPQHVVTVVTTFHYVFLMHYIFLMQADRIITLS